MTIDNPVISAPPRTTTKAHPWRHFLRHAVEMFVAMGIGMVVLGPAWTAAFDLVGLRTDRPEPAAFAAATSMTVAMTIWMLYRGHGRRHAAEMGAAMYVPYLLLLVPYWLGAFPAEHVVDGGHLLMLPAMAVAMLARRAEYSQAHHLTGHPTHPLINTLARRWPTWLALAMSMDSWFNPGVPDAWVMLVLPAAYLLIGGVRGRLRDPKMLTLQLAGLALYVVLAATAAGADPETAKWIVAGGWAFHALWDAAHHRANAVVPRGYAEWCIVVDLVVALTIVLFL
ncbi:hypothetical protein Kfla_1678 [Kribbella flavida DSM 17836]|uniref:Uncharacterized protein n=1 Tax=Kribbella flavida (strain DSM 17836 / JCM 10339 / NBRC 14399) TaxID=479435 RepID=D2PMM9_KRIFD|nr:hypothetical protein [Kribbella flavida]ADB30773.1 hypothetical protein Kfla_1678 [Kribbella flavida DSM 17836]